MAIKSLLRIVTVYLLITISTAEISSKAFSNDVGLKVLRIQFGLYISGASSGACLGHVWGIIWACMGHVWGIIWAWVGHHLGHVWGIIWGMSELSEASSGSCLRYHLGSDGRGGPFSSVAGRGEDKNPQGRAGWGEKL